MLREPALHIAQLVVYPIKSCGGIAVESAEVDAFGIRNDRRWMIVDAEGRFLTQRTVPLLATIRAGVSDGVISLRAAGRETLAVTGGTGFVGARLIDIAIEQGHAVRALTRRPQAGPHRVLRREARAPASRRSFAAECLSTWSPVGASPAASR